MKRIVMKKKLGKMILFSAYAAGAAYLLVSVLKEKQDSEEQANSYIPVKETGNMNCEEHHDETIPKFVAAEPPETEFREPEPEISTPFDEDTPEKLPDDINTASEPGRTYAPEVGSFILPEGWIEIERIRSQYKYFYCQDGFENTRRPDNISVSRGKNDFDIAEHEAFRNAVLNQLQKQISDRDTDEITVAQAFTDAEDVVYKFTISEKSGTTTVQYYIIGDHEFTLVQETNFSGAHDVDEAAEIIALTYRNPEIK